MALPAKRTEQNKKTKTEDPSDLEVACGGLSLNHGAMWNVGRMRGIWRNWLLVVVVLPSAM